MALTIRKMDKIRPILDEFKDRHSAVKTDTRAIFIILDQHFDNVRAIDDRNKQIEELESTIIDYERILEGLEKYTSRVHDMIKQQEIKL